MKEREDLKQQIIREGLESLGRYYGVYRGTVIANDDPKNIGRLKIKCAPIYNNNVPNYWAFGRGVIAGLQHGIFWIPSVGDPIYVTCENGDSQFPLWEYGWWLEGKLPEGAKPKVFVFLTPGGQRIEMNDETNSITITGKDGFKIRYDSDGLFIGKDGNANLGKLITDLFNLLEAATVPTIYGAMKFSNVIQFTDLKATITNFLKSS